jgi:hypothetical protein
MTVDNGICTMAKRDYLFRRPGSQNWWIKLQAPSNIEKSLGTPDRAQAEILALPYIQDHKTRLFEARPGIKVSWLHRFAPGQEHVTPDGERVVADDRELIFLNHNGAIIRKEPNGEFAVGLHPLKEQKAIVRLERSAPAHRADGQRRRCSARNLLEAQEHHRLLRARGPHGLGALQRANQ